MSACHAGFGITTQRCRQGLGANWVKDYWFLLEWCFRLLLDQSGVNQYLQTADGYRRWPPACESGSASGLSTLLQPELEIVRTNLPMNASLAVRVLRWAEGAGRSQTFFTNAQGFDVVLRGRNMACFSVYDRARATVQRSPWRGAFPPVFSDFRIFSGVMFSSISNPLFDQWCLSLPAWGLW